MTGLLYAIGRFCSRHWPTIAVWLLLAIAIDSTLVRCLLVPAVMVLLGERIWWLPGWMERFVPRVSIEGEEFFARRDAEAATAAAAGGR